MRFSPANIQNVTVTEGCMEVYGEVLSSRRTAMSQSRCFMESREKDRQVEGAPMLCACTVFARPHGGTAGKVGEGRQVGGR